MFYDILLKLFMYKEEWIYACLKCGMLEKINNAIHFFFQKWPEFANLTETTKETQQQYNMLKSFAGAHLSLNQLQLGSSNTQRLATSHPSVVLFLD